MIETTFQDDFERWLTDQPRWHQLSLAARAVARSVPVVMETIGKEFVAWENETTLLINLRATLTCLVAAQQHSTSEFNIESIRKALLRAEDASGGGSSAISSSSVAAILGIEDTKALKSCFEAAATASSISVIPFEEFVRSGRPRTDASKAAYQTSFEVANYDSYISVPEIEFAPLWPRHSHAEHLNQYWENFRKEFMHDPSWNFWVEWYQGLLDGSPLDWEVQYEIAKIPESDWRVGPEHIAKRIEEIRARFKLQQQITDLKAENARLAEKSRFEIGANGGPELEETKQVIQEIIWAPIDAIEVETKKDMPDTGVIRSAIDKLKQGISWLLTKSAENSLTFGMGWYLSDPVKAKAMLQSIVAASERWLQPLLNLLG